MDFISLFTYIVLLNEQIWPLVEKIDAEVLTEEAHPLLRKAVYSGLSRPSE